MNLKLLSQRTTCSSVKFPEQDIINEVKDGAIALVINQRGSLASGFLYKGSNDLRGFNNNPDVTEFSIFRIEFNQENSKNSSWWQNKTGVSPGSDSVDFKCEDEKCRKLLKKVNFRIAIDILLFSRQSNIQSIIDKSREWLCSSLIIDYVRVYDVGESEFLKDLDGNKTDKQASEICQMVIKM